MTPKLAWLALAGGLGTLARYGLSGLSHRVAGPGGFPWGTLVVNVTGCFAAGLLWTLFESRWTVTPETRTVVLVGFFGAFTTFSTFILETGELARSAEWARFWLNLTLQNGLGFAGLFLGLTAGRLA